MSSEKSLLSSDTLVYAHLHLSHGYQPRIASLKLLLLKRNMRQVPFFEKKRQSSLRMNP